MTPRRMAPDDPALDATLALVQAAFAPMQGRIDPPSSIQDLTRARLSAHAAEGALWVIGTPPLGALIASPQQDALYLGKIAVAPAARRSGLARQLIEAMVRHARDNGFSRLRLQTRVELVENHATFAALGFVETARTTHPGFARPTSITMERPVS
ncbi:GNAT family N-acetyltransferase [Oceaniglobus trochenteri]|uniref:GNAT family N-acetyltransferase n=1 Tax=Oceaniglobus trochenteri TaxID=2763260 RepID=UPI001CFFC2BA|nr:GNAT family N-acetyltransferase [Oceaniglobus trochenteri]